MAESEAIELQQYLSFSLREAEYALPILRVKEIRQYETVTPIPSVPRAVRGVMNLRGAVVPVVDLAARLGLAETPLTRLTCILVVEATIEGQPCVVGIMTDAVREVIELGPKDIEPVPAFGTRVRARFLTGVGKAAGRFALLLDVDEVVTAADRDVAEEIAGAAADAMPEADEPPPPPPPGDAPPPPTEAA
ncbi:MAG TPA: chemotaxis protein CheW [Anaeromyxobacter sp.]